MLVASLVIYKCKSQIMNWIASTYTFPTFIERIFNPLNYNAEYFSLFGLLNNLLGVIGGIVFAEILNYNLLMQP